MSANTLKLIVLCWLVACSAPHNGTVHIGTTKDAAGAVDAVLADLADTGTEGPETVSQDANIQDMALDLGSKPDSGDIATDMATPLCCGAGVACPGTMTCAGGALGLGTCKPKPDGGSCWSAADCPKGTQCAGALICPCDKDCGAKEGPGQCQGGPVDCCTTDFDCAKGERCVGSSGAGNTGVCKPIPAWGGCWDGNDCAPTQACKGGAVCPCNADCDMADTIGHCDGTDAGCCTTAGVCPAGQVCQMLSGIGWSTCVAAPEPGRCWHDKDCAPGNTCKGAALCPCNGDCGAGYHGPGVCTPPAPACTPIQVSWVSEVCDAASLVVWDGSKCVATCPGCCGCEPFCAATFQDVADCQMKCK